MPTGSARAKAILRAMGDFFWPPRSLISGARGMDSGPLSPEDVARLKLTSDPLSYRCGRPLYYRKVDETACTVCIARPPGSNRARVALIYDNVARQPERDLKRVGRRDGLETLCGWMRQTGGALIDEADVPVPLHFTRLAMHGLNQAGWLVQAIGAETGRRGAVDALVRTPRTPSQAVLACRARWRKVSGAFKVWANRRAAIEGKRVLLVDHVLTTGATLSCLYNCPETRRGAAR